MTAKPENLQQITAILTQMLGRPVILECQMGDIAELKGLTATSQNQPSDGSDPLVDFAVQDLGAEILDTEN